VQYVGVKEKVPRVVHCQLLNYVELISIPKLCAEIDVLCQFKVYNSSIHRMK
jgi:hypothetical protein